MGGWQMRRTGRWPRPVAALAVGWLCGCHGKDAEPGIEDNFGVTEDQGVDGCDNLLPTCLYPYPSDAYVDEAGFVRVPDTPFAGSDTTLDPGPIGTNRGFGAATPIVFQLPGAVAPSAPFDPTPSLGADARTVLIDATTGERIPHWVESDFLSPLLDPPMIVLRPSVPLPRGHTVVVGIRHLTGEDGAEAPAPAPFVALRDGTESHWLGIHARRATYDDVVFPALEAEGFARGELQLAWSFPVRSDEDATRDLVAVRDAVFAALPAAGPDYAIDSVTECPHDGTDPEGCHPSIRVIVDGTVSVPSAIGPADDAGLRVIRRDADGAPIVDGAEVWPFRLQLPNRAFDGSAPVPVLQYGHGFLGSASEANNGWLREMADRLGFAILACDMQGMNEDILPVWLEILVQDGGKFPQLQELPMQGVVNQLVQQRLVKTSLAADPDPRLRRTDGQLAWDPSTVWYFGNSQGGSVGTLVVATSLDLSRGVLGVPGSGYPLLLHRSIDFAPFVAVMSLAYSGPDAIPVFLMLLGTGWDSSDPLTFAPHLHGDPLPGTPDHEVLYHVAKEDPQVVNEASFISGRAAGTVLMTPKVRPVFGLSEVAYPASPGAALVEVDFGVPDDPTPLDPPDGDPSMPDGGDTHGWLRQWPPAQDQLVHFLQTGEVIDVCGGEPCLGTPPE